MKRPDEFALSTEMLLSKLIRHRHVELSIAIEIRDGDCIGTELPGTVILHCDIPHLDLYDSFVMNISSFLVQFDRRLLGSAGDC